MSRVILLDVLDDQTAREAVEKLPGPLRLIIEDMGTFLDDVHMALDIAKSFDSTPAQLLERLRTLPGVVPECPGDDNARDANAGKNDDTDNTGQSRMA